MSRVKPLLLLRFSTVWIFNWNWLDVCQTAGDNRKHLSHAFYLLGHEGGGVMARSDTGGKGGVIKSVKVHFDRCIDFVQLLGCFLCSPSLSDTTSLSSSVSYFFVLRPQIGVLDLLFYPFVVFSHHGLVSLHFLPHTLFTLLSPVFSLLLLLRFVINPLFFLRSSLRGSVRNPLITRCSPTTL